VKCISSYRLHRPDWTQHCRLPGVECSYSGRLSDSYTGTLACRDREAVPLKLWVK